MVTSIKTYVSRFHAASAKEDAAIVGRIQAVGGLLKVHSLKPADAARALFELSPDESPVSRHTSPVSHAATVAKSIEPFGFDVLASDELTHKVIRQMFRVSTGKVQAKRLSAAVKSAAEKVANGTPDERAAAVFAMVGELTTPAPRKVVTPDQRKSSKPAEVTEANAVPVVAIPATIRELIDALEAELKSVPPAQVGKYLARIEGLCRRARAASTAAIAAGKGESDPRPAKVTKGKVKVAA